MRQLLNADKVIDFMRWSKLAFAFSILMVSLSIATVATKGLNWGLDFTGGTLIEVSFENPANLGQIREALEKADFGDAVVQNFGTARDVMVRLQPRDGVKGEVLGGQIISALKEGTGQNVEMRRIEFVGPNVGDELAEAGGLAILISLLCILMYVSLRFRMAFSCWCGNVIGSRCYHHGWYFLFLTSRSRSYHRCGTVDGCWLLT